jgi:hypothetical protein
LKGYIVSGRLEFQLFLTSGLNAVSDRRSEFRCGGFLLRNYARGVASPEPASLVTASAIFCAACNLHLLGYDLRSVVTTAAAVGPSDGNAAAVCCCALSPPRRHHSGWRILLPDLAAAYLHLSRRFDHQDHAAGGGAANGDDYVVANRDRLACFAGEN